MSTAESSGITQASFPFASGPSMFSGGASHNESGYGPHLAGSLGPMEYDDPHGDSSDDLLYSHEHEEAQGSANLQSTSIFVQPSVPGTYMPVGSHAAPLGTPVMYPMAIMPAYGALSSTGGADTRVNSTGISAAAVQAILKSGMSAFIDPLKLLSDPNTSRLAAEIAAMPDSEPILQGFLRKEGTTKGSWKRRWFVLRKDRLEYFKKQESTESQGSISVPSIIGVSADSSAYPQPHTFQLITAGRMYGLQAPLDAAQRHWLSAITATVYYHMQLPNKATTSPGKVTLVDLANSNGDPAGALPLVDHAGAITLAGAKLKEFMDAIMSQQTSQQGQAEERQRHSQVTKALAAIETLTNALASSKGLSADSKSEEKPGLTKPGGTGRPPAIPADKYARPAAPGPEHPMVSRARSNSADDIRSTGRPTPLRKSIAPASTLEGSLDESLSDLPDNIRVKLDVEESYGNARGTRKSQHLKGDRDEAHEYATPAHKPRGSTASTASTTIKARLPLKTGASSDASDAMRSGKQSSIGSKNESRRNSASETAPALPSATSSRRGSVSQFLGAEAVASRLTSDSGSTAKLCKLRVEYAKCWINSLQIGEPLPQLPGSKIGGYFRDGTLLCALLEAVNPGVTIDGVNKKPRARAACIQNLEKALQVLWKARVRHAKIPQAEDIYDGREDRITSLLPELWETFAIRNVRPRAESVMDWLKAIHQMYGLNAFDPRSAPSNNRGLAAVLREGVFVALVAHLFCGTDQLPRIDLRRAFTRPSSSHERTSNWELALPVLQGMNIPVVLPFLQLATFSDSFSEEDDDAALLQLVLIHDGVLSRDFTLPFLGEFSNLHAAQAEGVGLAKLLDQPEAASLIVIGAAFADRPVPLQLEAHPEEPAREEDILLSSSVLVEAHAEAAAPLELPQQSQNDITASNGTAAEPSAVNALSVNFTSAAQVIAERNRLYTIALARASGNRGSSSAVNDVATKWANNKVVMWAQTLQVPEAIIAAVLQMAPQRLTTGAEEIDTRKIIAREQTQASTRRAPTAFLSPDANPLAEGTRQSSASRDLRVALLTSAPELAAVERSNMIREEKRSWELARQIAEHAGAAPEIPRRGGLFAVSVRTQPLKAADLSRGGHTTAAGAFSHAQPIVDRQIPLPIAEDVISSAFRNAMRDPYAEDEAAHDALSNGIMVDDGCSGVSTGADASTSAVEDNLKASEGIMTAAKHAPSAQILAPARDEAEIGLKTRALMRTFLFKYSASPAPEVSWGSNISGLWRQEGSISLSDISAMALKDSGDVQLTIRIAPNRMAAVRQAGGQLMLELVPASGQAAHLEAFIQFVSRMQSDWQSTKVMSSPPRPSVYNQQAALPFDPVPFVAQTQTAVPAVLPKVAVGSAQFADPFPVATTPATNPMGKFELRGLQSRSTQPGGLLASFLAGRAK